MNHAWWRWALGGLTAVATVLPSDLKAGFIPWPWEPRAVGKMTDREREREARYAERACDPIGARQKYKHGKLWPPFPRPTGPGNLPSHVYHAEHYWPYPFVCQDQEYVHAISGAQISNGWVTMTTLYDYHFDLETHQLNVAGRMQLRWILENAPPRHRYTFVQSGINNATSESRLQAVRTELTQLVSADLVPPVLLRVTSPLGRPAEEIDAIRRKDRLTIVEPRITPPIGNNNFGGSQASGN